MIIVTAGSAYVDIDAYAGCIAYAELLRLQGVQAIAASSAPLNESITGSIRNLGVGLSEYKPSLADKFVLIDISVEKFFDPIVKNGKVVEVIDHHPGHEEYWQEKLGDKAQIEQVGAACTQVYERWQTADKLELMRPVTAKILAAGILDNTLNFTAGITKDRDCVAYADLIRLARLGSDFPAQYFSEVQTAIEADLENAIKKDTKTITETTLVPRELGQLVVWNGKEIVSKDVDRIALVMESIGNDWGVNIISISEQKSYFVAFNPLSQQKFTDLLGVKFFNSVSEPHVALLRKEILRLAIDKSK